MSHRMKAILAAAFLTIGSAAAAGEAMLVPAGSAVTIRLDRPARQVIIGNPAVADVTVHSSRQLTLFGKSPAATTLTVLGDNGKVVLEAPVVVGVGSAEGLGVIYAAGKSVPLGGQRMAVECAAGICVTTAAMGVKP